MGKKKYVGIFVIIFLYSLFVVYKNFYSGYYPSAEEAVKKIDNYQTILKILEINKKQIIFYITNDYRMGLAHFKTKVNDTVTKYKVYKTERMDIGFRLAVLTYNTIEPDVSTEKDTTTERILYGMTLKSSFKGITINGVKANEVDFVNAGKEYILWYIIGGKELEDYKNKEM